MGFDTVLQQNDVGVSLNITVVQQNGVTPIDISSATSLSIYLTQPGMNVITYAANFVNNGIDGLMAAITSAGDLSLVGIYYIQASYSIGKNIKYTDKTNFLVEPNIMGGNY